MNSFPPVSCVDWDNPSLLIGGTGTDQELDGLLASEPIQKQIARSRKVHHVPLSVNGKTYNFVLCFGDPQSKTPVAVHTFFDREFAWILSDNPESWEFISNPAVAVASKHISKCDVPELIIELANFPPEPTSKIHKDNSLLEISGHYALHAIWLWYREAASIKDQGWLESLLHHTELIALKPYADLSSARREFAKQIFPRSELAKRAANRDLLWFCIEYSGCLQRQSPTGKSKDEHRTNTTLVIRELKEALKETRRGNKLETITIESLVESGEDWRLHIETLLIHEAIRLVEDEDEDDLYSHCIRYLDALSHFNGVVGHTSDHKALKRAKEKTIPRSRGRPPKSRM